MSGVSVAQVARWYGMNANLIHKWLKDERFASEPEADEGALFHPLEIDGGVAASVAPGTILKRNSYLRLHHWGSGLTTET